MWLIWLQISPTERGARAAVAKDGLPCPTGHTGLVELIAELWRRALATQPPPTPAVSAVIGGVALAAVLLAWPLVRLLVTVCHEAGHAVVATLAGRKLGGIRVHSDTSGLTVSKGRPTGPGMVATLFAGYPTPSVVGVGAAWLAGAGHSAGLLWLMVLLLALMLLKIRNLYGALVVLGSGAVVALASWYAPPVTLGWIACGLAWLFLLAAPRPVLELLFRHAPGSDAAQLAGLTHVPKLFWLLAWLVITGGALLGGAVLLLPGLAALVAPAG